MDRHLEFWERKLLLRSFRAAPEFAEDGLSQGFGTVLLKARDSAHSLNAADHSRLVVLLAVAAGGSPHPDAPLHLETACRDWCRGDRAMASIRLAFAPVAKLADAKDAYRLFLAEQAFDAGLDPETILREFGLADAAVPLRYDPNQLRVPAGSGGESGRFGSPSAPASTTESNGDARVTPVFFDPRGSLIEMKGGASNFQNHFIFYTDLTLTDETDPRLITFDVMKAHMMAIVWAFRPEWCYAGPGRLHDYLDRDVYVRPPMGLGWMTWIEGSLAKQIEVPRRSWNLELEAYSDGSLFMATGKETFSIENPTHLRQARAIQRQIDHLNYTSPFEGMSGRSDRVPPFPKF